MLRLRWLDDMVLALTIRVVATSKDQRGQDASDKTLKIRRARKQSGFFENQLGKASMSNKRRSRSKSQRRRRNGLEDGAAENSTRERA